MCIQSDNGSYNQATVILTVYCVSIENLTLTITAKILSLFTRTPVGLWSYDCTFFLVDPVYSVEFIVSKDTILFSFQINCTAP